MPRDDPSNTPPSVSSIRARSLRGAGPGLDEIVESTRGRRWAEGSGYIKRDGGRWVWMGALLTDRGEVALVIKARPGPALGIIPDRHAIKQAMGAARLRTIDIPTSEPIATMEVRTGSGKRERWLVLTALPGESLAHTLAHRSMSLGEEAALARRAGQLVRTLSEAGLFNRDHKASNLIVLDDGAIGVVDTVAIRRQRGETARRRMLLAMCKELAGIGALPRRAQLLRCLREATDDVRGDWREIGAMLAAAGDTTPRVDPLGRRA